jgi:hypothetical protein
MTVDSLAAALSRAYADGILVRQLCDDVWEATSSEPLLRGPYLVLTDDDGVAGHCGCDGGRYREPCKHRALVEAVRTGAAPCEWGEPAMPPKRTMSLEAHFWSKVERSGACWPWGDYVRPSGYGQYFVNRQPVYAHRLAWQLTYGPIPAGLSVLHRCDNRRCCRPDHLFLGDHQANMADMVAKGRHATGDRKPATTRVSDQVVAEVRRVYGPRWPLASGEIKALAHTIGITTKHLGELMRGVKRRQPNQGTEYIACAGAAHVYRPPTRVARRVAEEESVQAARRATAVPVTDRDYETLFPD